MRVHLSTRSGSLVQYPEIQDRLPEASGLTYETIMPGGMMVASCRIPWRARSPRPRINGSAFEVYDGIDCLWKGRVQDTVDIVQGGAQMIEIRAEGPWGAAARMPWTQAYLARGHTATDIIKAALYGNVEDVLIDSDAWDDPGLAIDPISWSQSNVQTAIGDCLRLGDTSTSPWSFLILRPRSHPAYTGGWNFYKTCSNVGDFSGTGGTAPTAVSYRYMRRDWGGSIRCAAPAAGQSYVYQDVGAGSANNQMVVMAWVYMPTNRPAEEHQIISIYRGAGTILCALRTNATHEIGVYNAADGLTYRDIGVAGGTGTVLGSGCWHHLILWTKIHGATGETRAYLDGRQVAGTGVRGTGVNPAQIARWGCDVNGTAARTIFYDNVGITVGSTAVPDMNLSNFGNEWLPEARIIKLDTSAADFVVSLSDIGSDYTLDETLANAANQLDVTYNTTPTYVAPAYDETSVLRYGQMWKGEAVSKISSATTAGYLRDRFLTQYKEPQRAVQPFTLRSAPAAYIGGMPYPLPWLRAGLRFRIQELPELGNIYVGQTVYKRGELDQAEECRITPFGATVTVDAALAGKVGKTWT